LALLALCWRFVGAVGAHLALLAPLRVTLQLFLRTEKVVWWLKYFVDVTDVTTIQMYNFRKQKFKYISKLLIHKLKPAYCVASC
jgi:hypothetical protein